MKCSGWMLVCVLMLCFVGVSQAQDKPAAPASSAVDGAKVFAAKCAACHGADGKGNKALGARDFTDAARMDKITDARIKSVILDGGKAHGLSPLMPPFKGQVSDAEIAALIKHIRAFTKKK